MKKFPRRLFKTILVSVLLLLVVLPTSAAVDNGGFETGDFTSWTVNYTGSEPFYPWSVVDWYPHSGTYHAVNGFDGDGPSYYTMYQDVVANGNYGSVNFWYYVDWDVFPVANGDRTFSIQIIDPATSSVLYSSLVFTAEVGTIGTQDWTAAGISFPAVAGKTYRVQFIEWIPEYFTGPATLFIDDISVSFTNYVPHVNDIRIDAGANVAAYATPGGEQAKLGNGQDLFLPQDYDGNGFDTFVVTETQVVDGVTWYSIFVGSGNFVWVNSSYVTPLN